MSNSQRITRIMPLVAAAWIASTAHSQPRPASFEQIDPGTPQLGLSVIPSGISADGSIVVGTDGELSSQALAVRWVRGQGDAFLPGIPGLPGANATGISADGTIIVGWCGAFDGPHACRWVNGVVEDLGLAPGGLFTRGYGISADGSVIVGVAGTFPTQIAFRWTEHDGYQLLPIPDGEVRARATAVTADGSVIFGDSACSDYYPAPASCVSSLLVWPSPTQAQHLCPNDPGFCDGSPLGCSADGSVLVGVSFVRVNTESLNIYPSVQFWGVSSDGRTAVGTRYAGGMDRDYFSPIVLQGRREANLLDLLAARGVDIGAWDPLWMGPTAISGDGKTISGLGQIAVGPGDFYTATFVAFLGDCQTADFNGDGDLGTDADIDAFFACLSGNCCPTCGSADFNGDGDIGTDADIESFFRVLSGGNC